MLDIVLRTHNLSNVHGEIPRYCGHDKTTLMLKCVTSLIHSMNACLKPIRLTILDDHSTDEFLEPLKKSILPRSRHPIELRHMKNGGQNATGLAQFQFMRDAQGLVYSTEDDYLHEETAINDMLDAYSHFSAKCNPHGLDVAIYPFDMPDNYVPPWHSPCIVSHGPRQHWRTTTWSTYTMMVPSLVVRRHWARFDLLARQYGTAWGRANNVHEGTTLTQIWSSDTRLFSPIRSIALHMQFEGQRDPYIDWRERWNSIPDWTQEPLSPPVPTLTPDLLNGSSELEKGGLVNELWVENEIP